MTTRGFRACAAVGLAVGLVAAWAPAAEGGQQGTLGNALNPTGVPAAAPRHPEGMGIVIGSRTPTGFLTAAPLWLPPARTTASGLRYRVRVEFGGVGLDGDTRAAKFREYKDLPEGALLNSFGVSLEQPKNGVYVEAMGGGVAQKDQFYGVDLGRYNIWRLRGSYSEIPHVFTSTYRNLWNGTGTSTLTLRSLTPGGTTSAAVTQTNMQAAIGATSDSDLELSRQQARARLDLTLPANWRAFASYSQEIRQGSRPFGAVFGGGGGGGNVEVPESIDYSTRDLVAGLQFANPMTSLGVRVGASYFTNNIGEMTFDNPNFINTNTIAGVAATNFTQGRFDLYPDNQHYNVRAEVGQKIPGFLRGRVTGLVSLGRFRQNDNLLPWSLTPLTGGTINGVSTAGVWDTTSALTRTSADARIDTTLTDVSVMLNPASDLTVRAKVRHYETDNSTDFLACNPLTGQWGRLLNNGSGGSFVTPNLTAGNNPTGTLNTGYNRTGCDLAATRALGLSPSAADVAIRSVPYDFGRTNATVSAEYQVGRTNVFDVGYERENFRRSYRDREKTWEDTLRVGYVNRAFSAGTLRASYERGTRRGSTDILVPLADFYSTSLGPIPTATGTNMATWVRNVDQFRRYDIADRDQHVMNLRFNHGLGDTVDLSVGLQMRRQEYPNSQFGRNGEQNVSSPSVELNWQLSPVTNAYGFYTYQKGTQNQTGVQQNNCTMGNFYYFFSDGTVQNNATGVAPAAPAGTSLLSTQRVLASNWRDLCGSASATSPLFPTSRAWTASHTDRNTTSGLGIRHEIGRVLAELNYHYTKGRTSIGYTYNAAALGMNATQVALAGSGFPDLSFTQNLIEANAVLPLVRRLSLRVLYRYEDAEIRDWHYDGISVNPMPANNAAYLDFGPRDYKVHFFGAFFRYEL